MFARALALCQTANLASTAVVDNAKNKKSTVDRVKHDDDNDDNDNSEKRRDVFGNVERPHSSAWRASTSSTAASDAAIDNDALRRAVKPPQYECNSPDELALLEAAEGKIGSTMNQVLLFCFHYSVSENRYVLATRRLMKAGGVVTVIGLAGLLASYWRSERRRQAAKPVDGAVA